MKTTHGNRSNHGKDEVRHRLVTRLQRKAAPHWRADLLGCVPELVRLMDEAHDVSILSISACVRDVVTQRCMTGAGCSAHDAAELELHVALVLDAMDRARRRELRDGEWDATPVPPQMFG